MTILSTNTWGFAAELTSAELNNMDANDVAALDKRAGQTDTLESVVSCSGAGRIRASYVAGANADTTYTLSSGVSIIDAQSATLTANRIYTLSTTGAGAGDKVLVLGNASFDVTVKVGVTTLLVVGTSNTGTNQSRTGTFLFNGTTWILSESQLHPIQLRQVFTGNGTYTVPADCYKLLVVGIGGGGGGGGGVGGVSSTTIATSGGGGGGAAQLGVHYVDTTPGTAIAVTIASGGAAGAGAAAGAPPNTGSPGSDGGSTTFGSILTFRGGQGGAPGQIVSTYTHDTYSPGGGPIAGGVRPPAVVGTAAGQQYTLGVRIPGEGGYGAGRGGSATVAEAASGANAAVSGTTGGSGTTSPGTGGTRGTTATQLGGGAGGGGGASAFGNGGNGGNGSDGYTGGGTPPSPTAGAAGGIGAGGGGGGSAGNSSAVGAANGAAGGAGGAGSLVVIPIR